MMQMKKNKIITVQDILVTITQTEIGEKVIWIKKQMAYR